MSHTATFAPSAANLTAVECPIPRAPPVMMATFPVSIMSVPTGWRSPSVCDEAIEQAGAAGGFQVFLAAAARAMRGVPGLHVPGVLQSGQIMVADDRRAFAALCPVAACGVAARCREIPGRVRARQDIVHVHGIAATAHYLALLRQSGLLVDVVACGMQILHALGHHHALGVTPRAFADALARVYARVAPRQCRAQVRAPVRALRADRLGERKAMRIGALQATEIGTVAFAHTGPEERHVCLLSLHGTCYSCSDQDHGDENTCGHDSRKFHVISL